MDKQIPSSVFVYWHVFVKTIVDSYEDFFILILILLPNIPNMEWNQWIITLLNLTSGQPGASNDLRASDGSLS